MLTNVDPSKMLIIITNHVTELFTISSKNVPLELHMSKL